MSFSRVLVIVPIKPILHPELRRLAYENASEIGPACSGLAVSVLMDSIKEPSYPSDSTPWSKVSRVRNRIIDSINLTAYDHICWIDADVIRYDPTIVQSLIDANPSGVSAPMVFIDRSRVFYDWAAFVMHGKGGINPDDRHGSRHGRQLEHDAPHWPIEPPTDMVDMDCVGTFYTVATQIYRAGGYHTDHPSFTDHWELCRLAREMGRRVTVNRKLEVAHCILPDFGEEWHV